MPDIACAPLRAALLEPGAAPKWRRLADAMRESVIRGDFLPNDRVPPESDLSRTLTVSVGTVQKALKALADEGLVVRGRRTGTFIADRSAQVDRVYVYRFRDPATGELRMPFVRTLSIGTERNPGPWRDALGAQPVRVDRLVWVEGGPQAFNSLFLSRPHGARLLRMSPEELHGSSCHKVLASEFNLPTVRMEHKIACRALSDAAVLRLNLAPGAVGMIWDVRDYAPGDEPVLFQRFEMAAGHPPMEIVETVEPAPKPADTHRRTRAR